MTSDELKEIARVLNGIARGEKWGIVLHRRYFPETTDDPIEVLHKGYVIALEKDFERR